MIRSKVGRVLALRGYLTGLLRGLCAGVFSGASRSRSLSQALVVFEETGCKLDSFVEYYEPMFSCLRDGVNAIHAVEVVDPPPRTVAHC